MRLLPPPPPPCAFPTAAAACPPQRRELSQRHGRFATPSGASTAEVASALRQLVESERSGAVITEALSAADKDLRADPRAVVHAVVAHVQRLFDIRTLEGVVPRMTQVYTQLTEARNFLRVLRLQLGLPPSAPVRECLERVRAAAEAGAADELLRPEYRMGGGGGGGGGKIAA